MDKWKVKKELISAHDDGWKSVILIPRWDNTTDDEKGERLKRFCSSASSSVWNIVSKLGTKMKGYFNPSWWQNFPL